MRLRSGRLLVAAIFFSSFGVSVTVGCSSFSAADAGTDDGGSTDAPALVDQAIGAEAEASTSCAAMGAVFCADFESGPFDQGWDEPPLEQQASFVLSSPGNIASPLHALGAATDPATSPMGGDSALPPPGILAQAVLSKSLDRNTTTQVGLELDLRVDNLASGSSILRAVALSFGNGQLVSIGLSAGTGFITIDAAPAMPVPIDASDATFPTPSNGTWFHLALEVDTRLATVGASIMVDGPAVNRSFDGFINDGTMPVSVSVGVVAEQGPASSGVSIDNVVVRLH